MVGISEVELHVAAFFYFVVLVKFGAVVSGDCFEGLGVPAHKLDDSFVESLGRFVWEFSNNKVSSFSLGYGYDTVIASFSEYSIDFPVSLISA